MDCGQKLLILKGHREALITLLHISKAKEKLKKGEGKCGVQQSINRAYSSAGMRPPLRVTATRLPSINVSFSPPSSKNIAWPRLS